jgi:hypothetical protein
MKRKATSAAVLAVALGIAFTSTAPAIAGADEVIKRGGCSGASVWKLKAKPDNGRLQVEGEVDSNHNGQTWHWKILHNGVVARRGTATTSGPSGSFSVERRVANAPGTDRIGWRATNPNTGETCHGGLSI